MKEVEKKFFRFCMKHLKHINTEYNKNIGWLKLTDEMIEDIENGNFKIKFEIKDPYMFEVGKEKDNK